MNEAETTGMHWGSSIVRRQRGAEPVVLLRQRRHPRNRHDFGASVQQEAQIRGRLLPFPARAALLLCCLPALNLGKLERLDRGQ